MFAPRALVTLSVAVLATTAPGALARPDQSPPVPDAVIDLRTPDGLAHVAGSWRYTDAHVVNVDHRAPGADLKPSGAPVKTHDIHPRVKTADFDAAPWVVIPPDLLEARRTNGRLSFGWYRLDLVLPESTSGFPVAGSTIVLELVVDDYAEVWVNRALHQVLGETGGPVIGGWNAPSRVTLTSGAKPGDRIEVAIFAANGPLSDPPPNYVWIRSATLDLYKPGRSVAVTEVPLQVTRNGAALDAILAPGTKAEKLADGFVFTEGPLWVPAAPDNRYGGGGTGGYLLFSDPNKNVIHRWDPSSGGVSIYRTKSGYSGVGGRNIGEYHQPGSNGLALDPQGRLTICEHGNRRVTRLEPNGTLTVLADRYQGKRLNSPNDLVYRSDGALYFTDPPFGLPKVFDDPAKELPHSGVYCLVDGTLKLASTALSAPNGLAFSPDEEHLYVCNWDEARKVVMRYDVGSDGALVNGVTFFNMTHVGGEICLDGLKTDLRGNVYVSGPGGVWVISAEGKHRGTFTPPELPANFSFGDDDFRTLYMTARAGLYRVRLLVPGSVGAPR
ncbi:MAG: SMP-30/gluconolactonase/LRE family protein [Phycisphaerales bacterium]